MQKSGGVLIYSPSDLITFLSDPFSSWMDRRYLEDPKSVEPDPDDESAKLIRKKGLQHEAQYLEQLYGESRDVCVITDRNQAGFEATLEAMRQGREIIYQAYLRKAPFAGLSDFLVRCSGKSLLGDFHYEVWDTKLARKPKPYFLIQLCCYAEMLLDLQGCLPAAVAVVLGEKNIKSFRTQDYYYYYQAIKEQFLKFQDNFDPDAMPEFIELGDYSRWTNEARKIIESRDELSLVAGIRKSQIKRLHAAGVKTVAQLASLHEDFDVPQSASLSSALSSYQIANATFKTLSLQARLQLESRGLDKPKFKIINFAKTAEEKRQGLVRLPPASKFDVFFDMEGYPHVAGGLEYLFGAVCFDSDSEFFHDWWAHDRQQEKQAFENFVDWLFERWNADREMHVYHYGAYEVSAMRRLASRHATREEKLDILLRANIFVDLYSIIRQSMIIGAESYSIKKVEQLYMEKREGDVSKATDSIVFYENWLENPDGKDWNDSTLLAEIRHYNKVDCQSTALLTAWLRERQVEAAIEFIAIPENADRPVIKPATPNEELAERIFASAEFQSADPSSERYRLLELFGHLLNFYGRERKVVWWEIFDRMSQSDEELFADANCIANVQRSEQPPISAAQSWVYEYKFDPDQEVKLQKGDSVIFHHDIKSECKIDEIDVDLGVVTLRRSKKREAPFERGHLVSKELVRHEALEESLREQAEEFLHSGKLIPCLQDFLSRVLPRVKGREAGANLLAGGESGWKPIAELIANLDQSYLCIQGPPGTGKTYVGANSIVELIKRGFRVGVSSNSHKAIEHMLEQVSVFALERGINFSGWKIGHDSSSKAPKFAGDLVRHVNDPKIDETFDDVRLVGATAWYFSRPSMAAQFDYLFIDEAGQVCLANVVAMSRAAKNLIFLGDQLQLDQPVKGSHPGESGTSSLEYLLREVPTIRPEHGIFLNETKRMHPALCQIVSSAVYEERLLSAPETAMRKLLIPSQSKFLTKDAGLIFSECLHSGNSQSSTEEIQMIRQIIEELHECQIQDETGRRRFVLDDVLIVAPYNQQVRLLRESIAGAEIGTVDKFQGRQAAVVIISMAASDLGSSIRGMEFLLSKKRLNVAISRAKILAIVVANPLLSQYACTTVEQSCLINMFCRIMQDGLRTETGALVQRI
ncbi:MAG: TM0106 family RecB-like putative nuclease [Candidatus Obscuribacterales bacterium]|nr:TM0106 family RecB-like putative nuclease [Candidatus Obscuribacterales bacterium]